ncbi:hypothetical protein [Lysobacter sp. Hz 25]|uniref:hypothetical protein n=1 Tax=Lysobacter sp. Hz 25 TaxID=3383698 RepID=UPI0038D50F6B
MSPYPSDERCPRCGLADALAPKLLLIDEAWVAAPGKDPRMAYAADLRVDDVLPSQVREAPLQQFVEGYYCRSCGTGFVSEQALKAERRRYK